MGKMMGKYEGTPSYHLFIDRIFHEINHPAIGLPPLMETPIFSDQNSTYQEEGDFFAVTLGSITNINDLQ